MDEEYKALTSVLHAFYTYGEWARHDILGPRRLKLSSLTTSERELIPWFEQHLKDLEFCIQLNEEFTRNLAINIATDWQASTSPGDWASCKGTDLDKVKSVLIQFTREWSDEGIKERDESFGRIIKEIESYYPDFEKRQDIKVLVPGAGLGRLVLDFVKSGFWCQGNEFSYHMLLASNFILNHTYVANHYTMFPFLHKFSHVASRKTQLRPITIPDYNPSDLSALQEQYPSVRFGELMSMCAGSFVDLYGPQDLAVSDTYTSDEGATTFRSENADNFDVVSTCFFLDTASNIIDYLKSIHHCLKKDGIWINFGPLLWHYEDDTSVVNIQQKNGDGNVEQIATSLKGLELSREDLHELIEKIGFRFEKYENNIETTYGGDSKSLGAWVYKCEYWVCKKI